jgi:hypothetical protein
MSKLVITLYEISKVIRDPTLYMELPEFRPIEATLKRYDEMAKTAPRASCCGGNKPSVSPNMDQELRKAVNSFVNIAMTLPISSREKLRKRYRTDELVIQYRDSITNQYKQQAI